MKKQNLGIGLLLMGLIIAQFPELPAWMIGMVFGAVGLVTVYAGMQEE